MSEEAAIPSINKESTVVDVVAYVGWKLQDNEFVEDLKSFIEHYAINGIRFLTLTEKALGLYVIREKRWREIALKIPEIKVDRNVKKPKYVAVSDIKLDQFPPVYKFQYYEQKCIPIPDEEFKLLYNQVNVILKNSRQFNPARNLHLIAPVLWCLTKIIPGLKLSCEESFCGSSILLKAKFEFVLHKDMLHVGLVEAKKEDMDQALSQLLMGQEVMCETTTSKTILGVISDFDRWDFIRNEPDMIFRDERNCIIYNVSHENGKLFINEKSLREIVGKFYGFLHENHS